MVFEDKYIYTKFDLAKIVKKFSFGKEVASLQASSQKISRDVLRNLGIWTIGII